MRQNDELDQSLPLTRDPEGAGTGADVGVGTPDTQLAELRARLQGKLRKLLHDSNSIRIRSQALSPQRKYTPHTTTNA